MFESAGLPKSLDESTFMEWLEKGRSSRLPIKYLMIVWNEMESNFESQFVESKEDILAFQHESSAGSSERLIAAYDIYSESKLSLTGI